MKWNWGTRLAIFALGFMIFVVTMVVIISRQDVPLVEENYYEKGLKYQQEIDNQNALDTAVKVDLVNGNVRVSNQSAAMLEGNLKFYRPSDAAMDINTDSIRLEPGSVSLFPMTDLEKGKWKVRFTWIKEGKSYFRELETER